MAKRVMSEVLSGVEFNKEHFLFSSPYPENAQIWSKSSFLARNLSEQLSWKLCLVKMIYVHGEGLNETLARQY